MSEQKEVKPYSSVKYDRIVGNPIIKAKYICLTTAQERAIYEAAMSLPSKQVVHFNGQDYALDFTHGKNVLAFIANGVIPSYSLELMDKGVFLVARLVRHGTTAPELAARMNAGESFNIVFSVTTETIEDSKDVMVTLTPNGDIVSDGEASTFELGEPSDKNYCVPGIIKVRVTPEPIPLLDTQSEIADNYRLVSFTHIQIQALHNLLLEGLKIDPSTRPTWFNTHAPVLERYLEAVGDVDAGEPGTQVFIAGVVGSVDALKLAAVLTEHDRKNVNDGVVIDRVVLVVLPEHAPAFAPYGKVMTVNFEPV